jgi:hypothetical protein
MENTKVYLNLSGHDNKYLSLNYIDLPLHVNLEDVNLHSKLTNLLTQYVSTDSIVTIVLPGLSPLTTLIIAIIHGLTGQFPNIVPMIRQPDGSFKPADNPISLQDLRNNISRTSRQNILVL